MDIDEWGGYHRSVDDLIDNVNCCRTLVDLSRLLPELNKAADMYKPYLRILYSKKKNKLRGK